MSAPPSDVHSFLVVRERKIELAWWKGGATRVPIVLLHEGLGSVSMWRDFPARLAEHTGRSVMAYSRFGHGRSDPPPAPHTTTFMHDEAHIVPEILTAANIPRAILLGHSDGGSIALISAALHPGRVAALVLEAPHVFVEDLSVQSIAERTAEYHDTHSNFRERLARHHANVDVAFHGWSGVWLDPAFRQWNIEEYVPKIGCPVLLVQGEDDQYGTLRQLDAIAAGLRGPVRRLVLAECGHSPHRDQPDEVLGAIAEFVRALE